MNLKTIYIRYLEPSLDYAELKSIWYASRLDRRVGGDLIGAAPVAIRMARKVLSQVNAIWVHLV